jgi:NAD(P)-dependent dehydrogenase (short-subunit alcohol dehydrogenase family)
MNDKTCVVTGANSGIGKATAQGLAALGAKVVMVCRDVGRGEAARHEIRATTGNDSLDLLLADLRSQDQVRRLAAEIHERYDRLDVLVNNAGTRFGEWEPTPDGIESTFGLNHLSVFLLTQELESLLKSSAPARVITIGSGTHHRATIDFNDLTHEHDYDEARAYDQSKLATVMFTYEQARRLAGTGVTVNCVDPGAVNTNIGLSGGPAFQERWRGRLASLITPEEAAATVIHVAWSPDLETTTGEHFKDSELSPSSPGSHDEDFARRLWDVSLELTRER